MMPILSAEQARALDQHFVETLGVPTIALMETASRALAQVVRAHFAEAAAKGVVVVCGGGNNGGDGYGCARWLASWGIPVRLWSLAGQSSGDAAVMRNACRAMGLPRRSGLDGAGLVVDAVFGIGLSRAVTGVHAEVVQAINSSGLPVVSADVPSGLRADTGAVLGVAVRADATVTFGYAKPGLYAEPGVDYAGRVHVAGLGVGPLQEPPVAGRVERADVEGGWPARGPGDHKNRSGHLLVLAGSRNLAGAAVLACGGALAAGIGLVTLAVPAGAVPRLGQLPPEVMVLVSGDGDVLEPLPSAAFARRTAILAGPGLGNGIGDLPGPLAESLRGLWRESGLPILFDADALTCGSAERHPTAARLITPHPGEAGRMLGRSNADVQADRFEAARALSAHGTAVLKGRNTLIAHDDEPVRVNSTGNAVLATGGTGDVLAGVLAGLLARGVSAPTAAQLGVWAHGRAADRLAARRTQGWRASDLLHALPDAIEELTP